MRPDVAEVTGDVPRAARDVLTNVVLKWSYEQGQGYVYSPARDELFVPEDNGRLVTWSSLVPRFVRELQRSNVSYKLDDHLDHDVRSPLIEPAGGYDPDDQELADVIGRNPRGQIVVSSLKEAIQYVAKLGELLADQNIVVVAANRKKVESIRRGVQRLTDRRVTDELSMTWRSKPYFSVCLPDSYKHCQPHDWQVVIFADEQSARAKLSFEHIDTLAACRRYALVPGGQRREAGAQLRLEAATGAVIYRSPTVAPPTPPVWAAMVQARQEQLPPGLNPLERKRRGIWLNDERNVVIMSIANALRTGKLKRLAKYGFPPAVIRRWTAVLKTMQGQSLMPRPLVQLAVVVESPEHARQLRTLLHPEAALAGAATIKLASHDPRSVSW